MTSLWKIYLPTFILLLNNGCMQTKVLKLTRVETLPGGPTEAMALTRNDSVAVSLGFNGLSYGNLDFTLEVRNSSADTIYIGPADCSYIPTFAPQAPVDIERPKTIPAIDPKQHLVKLYTWKADEEKATNPYNNLVSLAIDILGSLLISKEEQEKAAIERQRNSEEWESKHLETLYYISNQIEFWRVTPMGDILVVPNRTVSGRILFTVQPEATQLRFRIRLNGVVRESVFRQEMSSR
ncbi:MAG: hypothetical protein WCJ26_02290 [bacterium]